MFVSFVSGCAAVHRPTPTTITNNLAKLQISDPLLLASIFATTRRSRVASFYHKIFAVTLLHSKYPFSLKFLFLNNHTLTRFYKTSYPVLFFSINRAFPDSINTLIIFLLPWNSIIFHYSHLEIELAIERLKQIARMPKIKDFSFSHDVFFLISILTTHIDKNYSYIFPSKESYIVSYHLLIDVPSSKGFNQI